VIRLDGCIEVATALVLQNKRVQIVSDADLQAATARLSAPTAANGTLSRHTGRSKGNRVR
jgi:hypothetical protein